MIQKRSGLAAVQSAAPPAVGQGSPEPLDGGNGPQASGSDRAKGVLGEIADELRWTVAERKGWLVGIGFNIGLAGAYVGYTHYQPGRPDSVRIAGIATGVAVWVLADVINTNQLGADADRVSASLGRGRGVARELALKNSALAVTMVPLAVVLSVGVRLVLDRWRAIPHAVLFDLFVVFMWLGLGNVLSVLLPYRPVPLRERWHARRSWLRWVLCITAPYIALLAVNALRWPADRLAHQLLGRPERQLLGFSFLYMCWGFVLWGIGLAVAGAYGSLARARLGADLRRSD